MRATGGFLDRNPPVGVHDLCANGNNEDDSDSRVSVRCGWLSLASMGGMRVDPKAHLDGRNRFYLGSGATRPLLALKNGLVRPRSFGVALEPGQRCFDFLPGAGGTVTSFRGRHQGESFAHGIGGFTITVIFVVGVGEHFVELEGIGLAAPAGLIEQR